MTDVRTLCGGVERVLQQDSAFRLVKSMQESSPTIDRFLQQVIDLTPGTAVDLSYLASSDTLDDAITLISALGQIIDSDTPDPDKCVLQQIECSFVDGLFLVELKLELRNAGGEIVTRGKHPVTVDVVLDLGRAVENSIEVAPRYDRLNFYCNLFL